MKIKDNGTGISEDHITKIYDIFFRSEFHRLRLKWCIENIIFRNN